MVEHKCERCGYLTNKVSHLKQHLRKAKICPATYNDLTQGSLLDHLNNKADPDLSCDGCQKVFSSKYCLSRHQQTCSAHRLAQDFARQLREFKAAQQPPPVQAAGPSSITNNNSHNHTTNNIDNSNNSNNSNTTNNFNITINNIGNEDLSHLTPEFYKACVQNGAAGLVKFIDKVHFDGDHPENKNVKHLSKKQQLLYKYEDGKWVECDRNFTLNTMIDKNKGRLQRFIMTNEPLFSTGDDEYDNAMLIQRYHNNYEILKIGTQHFYALRREVYSLVLKEDEEKA